MKKTSVQNIIINQSNHVDAGFGNRYIYKLDRDIEFNAQMKVGLQSIKMYNSSFNISSDIGNNIITLKWFSNTHTIIIPNGYYEVIDLNFFLQKQLILLGYYYFDSSNNYYNWELVTNPTEYSININYYALPLLADSTQYTKGSGSNSWDFPASAIPGNDIQLNLNPVLAKMLGFTQLNFPLVRTDTYNNLNNTQYSSNITPNIQYISSYVISCNLIDSIYSSGNSNILASVPIDVEFGLTIKYVTPQIVYTDIKPSRYREIVIEFLDQKLQPLKFIDKNILIVLSVLEEK